VGYYCLVRFRSGTFVNFDITVKILQFRAESGPPKTRGAVINAILCQSLPGWRIQQESLDKVKRSFQQSILTVIKPKFVRNALTNFYVIASKLFFAFNHSAQERIRNFNARCALSHTLSSELWVRESEFRAPIARMKHEGHTT